jgi:outer membrane lipoprotein carrier protein
MWGSRDMLRHRYAFLFTLAAWLIGGFSPANANGIDRLRAFVDGTKTASADFTQTVIAKSGGKPRLASGRMAFSRPGKFRWTYEKPYYQLIVGDGEKVWVYDKDLNQVTVKKLGKALGGSPAALLAGDNAIEKNFALQDAGKTGSIEWVEARPKSADSSFEHLRLGFADGELRVMELADNFGQLTTLNFDKFDRNPKLDTEQFRFTPPKGADVVGEE